MLEHVVVEGVGELDVLSLQVFLRGLGRLRGSCEGESGVGAKNGSDSANPPAASPKAELPPPHPSGNLLPQHPSAVFSHSENGVHSMTQSQDGLGWKGS